MKKRNAIISRLTKERLLGPLNLHIGTAILLIAINLIFVAVAAFGNFGPDFRFGVDSGWPERFNFLKWALIAALCVPLFLRWHNGLFAAFGAVALLLLAEDSLMIHERLAQRLLDVTGVRRFAFAGDKMLAEVLVFAGLGIVCLLMVLLALRAQAPRDRGLSAQMLLNIARIVGIIAFFGVGVDLLHDALPHFIGGTERALRVLEETGEMFGISILVAYFAGLFRAPSDAGP